MVTMMMIMMMMMITLTSVSISRRARSRATDAATAPAAAARRLRVQRYLFLLVSYLCFLLLFGCEQSNGSKALRVRRRLIGCGPMESALVGPLQKVMNFDRLGKKVRPGTFGKIKVGQREYPKNKKSLSKNIKIAVTPLVLTPFVSFRIIQPPVRLPARLKPQARDACRGQTRATRSIRTTCEPHSSRLRAQLPKTLP